MLPLSVTVCLAVSLAVSAVVAAPVIYRIGSFFVII